LDAARSGLPEASEEGTVHAVAEGEGLGEAVGVNDPAEPGREPRGGGFEAKVGRAGEESADEIPILFGGEGAGGIDEEAAGAQEGGDVVQYSTLQFSEFGEGARVEAPAQVGPTAEGSEAGAGGVDEDAVKRDREKGERLRGVGEAGLDAGDSEAGEVFADLFEACGLAVEGEDAAAVLHEFGEVGGLAAGGGAGVENDVAGAGVHDGGNQLSGGILDLDEAVAKGAEAEG